MYLNNMYFSWVYILSNYSKTVFYIGVTADISDRVLSHKKGNGSVFTSKYKLKYLMYLELFEDIECAIAREKQLKNWHRDWKLNLIKSQNPHLLDLANDWYSDCDFK